MVTCEYNRNCRFPKILTYIILDTFTIVYKCYYAANPDVFIHVAMQLVQMLIA